jgi:hypothetical protein
MVRCIAVLAVGLCLVGCGPKLEEMVQSPLPEHGGEVVVVVAAASDSDPYQAGKLAAESLRKKLLGLPRAVIVSECYEGADRKESALRGVCSVFPREVVFGAATYGSFTHDGCTDRDAITLLALAGRGISVAAALESDLGVAGLSMEKDQAEIEKRLRAAGARLAAKLPKRAENRLLIVFADAHAPQNASLVEGIQEVVGKPFPITGGSANKNAGQTLVYYQGRMFEGSAVALMVMGDFEVAMDGRQAKEADAVVTSAKAAVVEAFKRKTKHPFAVLAFDCAGRKGKLQNLEDELRPIKEVVGRDLPLFGCYCAGEIGPPDIELRKPGILSSGVAWHIMVTVLAR